MKVLVTGVAGFIGSNVAHALLDAGHEVVGIDNFNDYYPVAIKEMRHSALEKRKGYIGIRGDFSDLDLMNELFGKHRFERVCHLGAQAGVRYSLENPHAYEQSNLAGHLNVLECCRNFNVSRLVYASSSSVYGGNKKVPFSESDPVDHPVSLYAATKKANELMSHAYTDLYGFQTIGLRFFTVYGPAGRPDMAYWLFTDAMLQGRAIKVFNHGDMKRDFTYIDDVVQGVSGALFAEGLDPYEIFNLGNNQPELLMDMIRYLGKALDIEPQMEMLPMQAGDVPVTYADIGKAKIKLGYNPCTDLESGLEKFVSWYKDWKKS
ncbi:NAD-dependent epimerase/dehydratase family protein [Pontiella agarivorans]|uniref:NAD-dependent epimerase/dehydratase family protein n=1 Tax=Pontiella agarivorans TaxID=3038953 RepID=A0ABU5MUD1_9BACT|nr:NAD-dependent epimerase/dehydratase family protein [Pontiella agarivorans]MDZ8117737.1 NAD-dependent epimerase/dehydratase family protein [Pontiella agarivorans]